MKTLADLVASAFAQSDGAGLLVTQDWLCEQGYARCPHCHYVMLADDVHGDGTCTVAVDDGSIRQFDHASGRWSICHG